jgi:hypothetical protein
MNSSLLHILAKDSDVETLDDPIEGHGCDHELTDGG